MNPITLRGYGWWPSLLFLTLFGSLVLPMLPVWQGAIRVLAGLVLLDGLRRASRARILVGGVLLVGWAISLFFWGQSLLASPALHIIASLTDVYGQPLGLLPDGLLLIGDIICLAGLLTMLHQQAMPTHRRVLAFAATWLLFWCTGLLTVIVQGLLGNSSAGALAQMITGLSVWATWLYWAFLALLLLRNRETQQVALICIGLSGAVIGGIIACQWLLGDFSYMITSHGSAAPSFNRVRGTDYYHAPATFAVVVGCLALFGMQRARLNTVWLLLALMLTAIAALNNTRGVSIACAAGLVTMLSGALYARRRFASLCLIAALGITLPNVLYLKPAYHSAEETAAVRAPRSVSAEQVAAEESASVPAPRSASAEQLAGANEPRRMLAREGLNMLWPMRPIGTGMGTLELPLEGNAFDGLTSTYSTHTLYLDIALMGGILSLAGFLGALAVAASGALTAVVRQREYADTSVTTLAILTAYAVAWFFLPQERNEMIGVAAFVSGLAVCAAPVDDLTTGALRRMLWPGYAVLAMGALAWGVLTSPHYVFPAIELVARYGREIVQQKQSVVVTEPAMLPLLRRLVALRGGEAGQVSLLHDGPHEASREVRWIVWDPSSVTSYPHLIDFFTSWRHVYHGGKLGFTPPPHWWVMPSAQPVVSFIFAGPRGDIASTLAGSQRMPEATPDILTYPNYAPYTQIKTGPNVVGDAAGVADYNHGSVVYWPANAPHADIHFSLDGRQSAALRYYRMTALPMRSMHRVTRYTWMLEGSDDLTSWALLDQRSEQILSQSRRHPSTYRIEQKGKRGYLHYRFRFLPATADSTLFAGIAEVELFFGPTAETDSK